MKILLQFGRNLSSYKSEGRWFYPRWCRWNFSLT